MFLCSCLLPTATPCVRGDSVSWGARSRAGIAGQCQGTLGLHCVADVPAPSEPQQCPICSSPRQPVCGWSGHSAGLARSPAAQAMLGCSVEGEVSQNSGLGPQSCPRGCLARPFLLTAPPTAAPELVSCTPWPRGPEEQRGAWPGPHPHGACCPLPFAWQ